MNDESVVADGKNKDYLDSLIKKYASPLKKGKMLTKERSPHSKTNSGAGSGNNSFLNNFRN